MARKTTTSQGEIKAKEALAERLKMIQKRSGMPIAEFCAEIGIGVSTFGNYRSGNVDPLFTTLLRFAEIGNVPIDWLMTGDGSPDSRAAGSAVNSLHLRQLTRKALQIIENGERDKGIRLDPIEKADLVTEVVLDGLNAGTVTVDQAKVIDFMALRAAG